jgi:hypothetical protein
MKTAKEMGIAIGQECFLTAEKGALYIKVVVHDVRNVFGRVDCLVQPVAGAGRSWVACDRLKKFEYSGAEQDQDQARPLLS